MDANPLKHASPDEPTLEVMDAALNHTTPDKPKVADTMDVINFNPPSNASLGLGPAKCSYSVGHELRSHFFKCLQKRNIKPFPSKPIAKRRPLLQTLKIYCKC